MAAGTSLPETSPARGGPGDALATKVIEYDRYIETQLHRTRRQVKGVDISSSLMLLAVASLLYLTLVALIDHWLVSGGLGFLGRLAAFGLLAAGVAAFCTLRLVPLLVRRVNPVYAAYTIEQHRPGIKNGLINFLLLRTGAERLPDRVYQAMEAQAANALTAAHAEVAVDRTPVIRLLLALVALIFCVSLYAVLSPKSLFTSFRRVVAPWSDLAPPTRVTIGDILPGDGRGFHDQHVAVSAQVDGLRSGESVTLHYSTLDGQVTNRPTPMVVPENSYRHVVELPPDNIGLQQDLEYWIEAGDATSPHYQIKVDTAPTMTVEEIEYQYPKYSGLPPRKVARHGDIQALAGTRVSLRAKANQVVGQADLDFECDGRNDLSMQIDGPRASVVFPLMWNEQTRRAEHESYQLRFRNQDGYENPKPIRYAIEVIRDLPPEVELVEPDLDPAKELMATADKPVKFAVEAADSDFKLAAVRFHARRGGAALLDESLLPEPRGGQFRRDYVLDLKRLALKPGEQIEFWASADDNREPRANHVETPHYRLRVATVDDKADDNRQSPEDPDAGQQDENRPSKSGKSDKQSSGNRQEGDSEDGEGGEAGKQDSKDRDKSDDKSKAGSKSKGGGESKSDDKSNAGSDDQPQQQQGEGSGADPSDGGGQDEHKRLDPQRDAGRAIDEVNKHFNDKEKQQNEQQPDGQQPEGKQPDGQQPGEKSGDPDKQQSDDRQQNADRQPGKMSGDEKRQDTAGEQQGDETPQGGEQAGKKSQPQKKDEKSRQEQPRAGEQNSEGESPSSKEQQGKRGGKPQQAGKQEEPSADGETPEQGDKQQGGQQQTKKREGAGKQAQAKPDRQAERGAKPDKDNDQQPGPGQQNAEGEQAKGDKSQDKRQADKQRAKNGKQPSAAEKGRDGDEQGMANAGGDKSEKDPKGDAKPDDAKVGDEQLKNADGQSKPRDGKGGQAKGAGEPDEKVKKHQGESPDQKGGDSESRDKGDAGAGDSEGANKHGSPSPQDGEQQREKKQISPDAKKGTSEDQPESPNSRSKRQSDSQGGERGDREGGGKSGGGQRSNSQGTGSAGQNTESDQGGGLADTQGKGPAGQKGGDQQRADKPTGGKASGEKGPGTNQGSGEQSDDGRKVDSPPSADMRGQSNVSRDPSSPKSGEKRPAADKRPESEQPRNDNRQTDAAPRADSGNQAPQGQPTPGERGGHDLKGGQQSGNPTAGGQPGPDSPTPPPADDSEPGGDDPNQEYARKATDLALQRLKDQLAKDKPDPELLDKLQWTREDIEQFVRQWERLKKSADESGPRGDAGRQELDDALRSLGLRPRGTSLSGEKKRDDRLRNLRAGRRSAPPPEYAEQWIEFNKATAKGGKR